jgi:hypothetical protein
LEQTPWANPQHPVHQHRIQQAQQRRNEARISSPKDTPSGARRKDSSTILSKNIGAASDGPLLRENAGIASSRLPSTSVHPDSVVSLHQANSQKVDDISPSTNSLHLSKNPITTGYKPQTSSHSQSTTAPVSGPVSATAKEMFSEHVDLGASAPQANQTGFNDGKGDTAKLETDSNISDALTKQISPNLAT